MRKRTCSMEETEENVPVAQFQTDAWSHVVFSLPPWFCILFIQLEAFSDSCAEMSSVKLETDL